MFEGRNKNFMIYVGPEQESMHKVRVNGKMSPMNTNVKFPPEMRYHTKHTWVQWEYGEIWERDFERDTWMEDSTTSDEGNRPVRLLVFAVPEKSEQHGIAYMYTPCLSPLTSRTGIMTKRQHQIDMRGVEIVNKQDKCLVASG